MTATGLNEALHFAICADVSFDLPFHQPVNGELMGDVPVAVDRYLVEEMVFRVPAVRSADDPAFVIDLTDKAHVGAESRVVPAFSDIEGFFAITVLIIDQISVTGERQCRIAECVFGVGMHKLCQQGMTAFLPLAVKIDQGVVVIAAAAVCDQCADIGGRIEVVAVGADQIGRFGIDESDA